MRSVEMENIRNDIQIKTESTSTKQVVWFLNLQPSKFFPFPYVVLPILWDTNPFQKDSK